jgi:hypothetical protein
MCLNSKKNRKICHACNTQRASFVCKTCNKSICIYCVLVTVFHGKWNFYCDMSCVHIINNSSYVAECNMNDAISNAKAADVAQSA